MADPTDITPIGYDGYGAPLYGWQVADRIPETTKAALAEVRAQLESAKE